MRVLALGIVVALAGCGGQPYEPQPFDDEKWTPKPTPSIPSCDFWLNCTWSFESLASLSQRLRLLQAGEFWVGSDSADAHPNQTPRHLRQIDAIEIANVPILNEDMSGFVDFGGYQQEKFWSPVGWRWLNELDLVAPMDWEWIAPSVDPGSTDPRVLNYHAVTGVSFYEAEAFAQSLGCIDTLHVRGCTCLPLSRKNSVTWQNGTPVRLPTEAELEVAASLSGSRCFASDRPLTAEDQQEPMTPEDWVNAYDGEPPVKRCPEISPRPISSGRSFGRPPTVQSGSGVVSNCQGFRLFETECHPLEWTSSAYEAYPGSTFVVPQDLAWTRVARGPRLTEDSIDFLLPDLSDRTPLDPSTRDRRVGFRVVVTDPSYVDCVWSDLRLDCPYR